MNRRSFISRLVSYVAAAAVACRLELAEEKVSSLLTAEPTVEWSRSIRRRIYYNHPNGASPLLGFINKLDNEPCVFEWHERTPPNV